LKTYKILCIALFAVLLSVLYFIESKYGEMSMFNGTPPFEFGDTGRRFVDVLETPILFAWFGVLFEVFQMAVKKWRRTDRENLALEVVWSVAILAWIVFHGIGMDKSLYTISDSGVAVAAGNCWQVMMIPLGILSIQFIEYIFWSIAVHKASRTTI